MGRLFTGLVLVAALIACDGGGDEPSDAGTDAETSDAQTGSTTGTAASGETAMDSADAGPDDSSASSGPSDSTGSATTGSSSDPCQPGGEPSIEIGHGLTEFEPLDAHPAELIYGVQGGFHIVLGVRGVHIDTSDTSVVRFTGTIEDEQLAFSAPYVQLECADSGQEAINLLLIWDSTPDFLHGKTAFVQAELTDPGGQIYRAEGEVVIDDPQMN